MAAAKKSLYPETSMERAAYLAAHDVFPVEGEWIENGEKEGTIYAFMYAQTDKLGKLVVAYKMSKFNTLMGTFHMLYRAKGKKLKADKYGYAFTNEEMDLCTVIKEYKNPNLSTND